MVKPAKGTGNPIGLCTDVENCRSEFCVKNPNTWPATAPGILDPEATIPLVEKDNRTDKTKLISCLTFLTFKNGQPIFLNKDKKPLTDVEFLPGVYACNSRNEVSMATEELVAALREAGKFALEKGYYIQVTDAYRTLDSQIEAACWEIKQGNGYKLGGAIAWPGGSNHGAGHAVDMMLYDPKAPAGLNILISGANCDKQHTINHKYLDALDEIMTKAGFKRYEAETWHYELNGPPGCRCQFPNCPYPTNPSFCKKCSG